MGNSQSHSGSSGGGGGGGGHGSGTRSRSASASTTIDLIGTLHPQSHLYCSQPHEYSQPLVHQLIQERRLAPFHLGLNDFEPTWDVREIIKALHEADSTALQNLRDALANTKQSIDQAQSLLATSPPSSRKLREAQAQIQQLSIQRDLLQDGVKHLERKPSLTESQRVEQARRYAGRAIECPICFLYYPPPLVHTRCCDQPICTECFVMIHRAEPDAQHLESEPACCPFCMESNFGVLYQRPTAAKEISSRPPLQTLVSSEVVSSFSSSSSTSGGASSSGITISDLPAPKARRRSFAHTEKDVVTTDQIYPEWQAKVEAVRAAVARRANRRIVFRQVGDRLIPIGITSSRGGPGGANGPDGQPTILTGDQLPPGWMERMAMALDESGNAIGGGAAAAGGRGDRRRNQEMQQLLQSLGLGGLQLQTNGGAGGGGPGQQGGENALEEMMVMEAMRLSMLEEEERQKKEAEQKKKEAAEAEALSGSNQGASTSASSAPGSESPLPPIPTDEGMLPSVLSASTRTPHTPTTTASLLSDALEAPMTGIGLDIRDLRSTTSASDLVISPPLPASAVLDTQAGLTPLPVANSTADALAASPGSTSTRNLDATPRAAGYAALEDEEEDEAQQASSAVPQPRFTPPQGATPIIPPRRG